MTDGKMRIGLTLTKVYVEALDGLVEEGLYLERQDAIRDSLRRFFQFHGIKSFRSELVAEVEKVQE